MATAAITVRKDTLGNNWKRLMRTLAARLHMHVVTEWGEGACHAVRNAVAAAIALEKGFLAAAHYLGDDVETVRDTYGFLDGTAVDATDLAGVSDLPGFKPEVSQGSRSGVTLYLSGAKLSRRPRTEFWRFSGSWIFSRVRSRMARSEPGPTRNRSCVLRPC